MSDSDSDSGRRDGAAGGPPRMASSSARSFGRGFGADVRRQLAHPLPHPDNDASPIRYLPGDKDRAAPFLPIDYVVAELDRLFGEDGWAVTTVVAPHVVWCERRPAKGEKAGGKENWCVTAAATERPTLRGGRGV